MNDHATLTWRAALLRQHGNAIVAFVDAADAGASISELRELGAGVLQKSKELFTLGLKSEIAHAQTEKAVFELAGGRVS